ncbi:hypothetical protein ACLOJK_019974 [Asimina triloba]
MRSFTGFGVEPRDIVPDKNGRLQNLELYLQSSKGSRWTSTWEWENYYWRLLIISSRAKNLARVTSLAGSSFVGVAAGKAEVYGTEVDGSALLREASRTFFKGSSSSKVGGKAYNDCVKGLARHDNLDGSGAVRSSYVTSHVEVVADPRDLFLDHVTWPCVEHTVGKRVRGFEH